MSEPTDPLDEAWSALRAEWSVPQRHRAFVVLAASLGRLPDAAGRYRAVESDPELREGAERGKKLVLSHAMAQLEVAPRASRDAVQRRGAWLAPLATLGFLLTASFTLSALTHRREFVSPAAIGAELLIVALLPWKRLRK